MSDSEDDFAEQEEECEGDGNVVIIMGEGNSPSMFIQDFLSHPEGIPSTLVPSILSSRTIISAPATIKTKYYACEIEFWLMDAFIYRELSDAEKKAIRKSPLCTVIIILHEMNEERLQIIEEVANNIPSSVVKLCLLQPSSPTSPISAASTDVEKFLIDSFDRGRFETVVLSMFASLQRAHLHCESSPQLAVFPHVPLSERSCEQTGLERVIETLLCTEWRIMDKIEPPKQSRIWKQDTEGEITTSEASADKPSRMEETEGCHSTIDKETENIFHSLTLAAMGELGEQQSGGQGDNLEFNLDEGLDNAIQKIKTLRDKAQGLDDIARRDLAARVALQFAALIGLDEDELEYPEDMKKPMER